jgi:hypothetical protein
MVTRGFLLGATAAALYVWLAPTHIVDGDNAEFATLGASGGTAHPSGYPLYLLWLRAMQWLPGTTPAHTAAIATALIGAAAVVMVHAACRAWGAGVVGATVAAGIFAGAPVVMRTSSEAEVFALNNLVVATVLWLAAARAPHRGFARVVALAFVAGLGMSNHMTCVLVAPVGLLGAVRGVRESARHPALSVGAGIGALVVGLLPYAYLLATPETPLSWGKVHDLAELYAMITRQDYGGPGAFLPSGAAPSAWTQIAALCGMLGRTWLVVGAVAGGGALCWYAVRRSRDGIEPRIGWALLAVSFVIAGPVLVMRFNLDPRDDLGLYVCQRFYLLPALLLAIPFAVAMRPVDTVIARSRIGASTGAALVATVGTIAIASLSLGQLARTQTAAVEQYARNLLHALPQDAVVFLGRDEEYFGIGYLQWARGERRDVTVVAHQLVVLPWYQQRIAARGIVAPAGDGPPILRVIDGLLAAGRPVFVEKSRTEVIAARPTYPFATVMKVLPKGHQVPSPEAVVTENEQIYARFELGYPRPGPNDEFASAVHRRYAATWTTLARKLEQIGDLAGAAHARALAAELAPHP